MGLYSVVMAEEDNVHPPADQLPDNLKPPTPGQLRQYNFETWFTTDPSAKVTFIIILNLGCVFTLTVLFFLCNCLHQMSGMHRFLETMWWPSVRWEVVAAQDQTVTCGQPALFSSHLAS